MAEKIKKGMVYLVGAGPGDPGLLTIKARECIEKADVLVYDYLANFLFLEYAHPEAEHILCRQKGR
jgi:uroporphyrinogen III methyltransferase/synthase